MTMTMMAESESSTANGQSTLKGDIVKKGYLRKLKTSKRKFFVLKVASRLGKARLEYFDSEKKFATHQSVKKTILISECFEISKIEDKKYDYVFALFTKDEKLSLIADSAEERQEWLQALSDARKDSKRHGELLVYDEIWPVVIKDKGIAPMQNLVGSFHLAKVNRCLRILKENSKEVVQEFLLANIKRSGYSGNVLLLEIGRSHPLGPGDIWFEVADSAIAEKMHHIIFGSTHIRPRSVSSDKRHTTSKQTFDEGRRKSSGPEAIKEEKKGHFRTKSRESIPSIFRSKSKEALPQLFHTKSKESVSSLPRPKSKDSIPRALRSATTKNNARLSKSTQDITKAGVISPSDELYRRIFTSKEDSGRRRTSRPHLSKSTTDVHKTENTYSGELFSRVVPNVKSMVSDIEERHKQDKNTVKKPKIETCSSVEIFERMTSYRKPKQTKMNVSKSVEGLDKVCDSYNDSIYANVVPNGRPATINFDALGDGIVDSLLKKDKWKSLDDSLKGSSTCSSLGDDESLDDSHADSRSVGQQSYNSADSLPRYTDEGYIKMTYSSPTKEIPLNNNHESANRGDNYTIFDPKSGQYTTKMLDRAPSPLVDSTYEDMYIKMFPEQSRPHHLLPTTAAATATTAHHAAAADKQHCYENVTADTLGELPSIPPRDSGNAGDELYDLNAGQQYSGSKKKARPSSLPCREPLETCSEGVNNKLSSVNSQGLTNTGKDVTDVSVSGPHARHGKLKGLKKSMTLAFSRSSPKKQSTEATSRFYIEPSRESIKQGKVKSSQFYIDSQGESIKESKPESLNSQRESSYESIEENNAEPGDKIAEIEEYSPDCVTPTENMGKRRIYSKKDSSAADMNINFENLNMKSKTADQLDIKSLDKHGRSNGQTLCEHSPDDYMNVGAHRSGSPEMMIREFGASKSRAIHRKNRDDTKYMLISFDDQSKKPGKKAGSPDMGKRFEEEKNSADETEMPRYVNVAIGRSKNEEYRITGIDQVYENPPSDKKTRESHKRSKSADHTANLSLSKTGMLEFVELKGKGRSAATGDSAKLDPSRYVNLHQLGSPNLESVTEDISESQDKLDETKNLDSEANLSHSPTRQREKCQRAAHTNHKYYTSVDLEKFCKTSEKSGSPTDSPPDSPGSPGSPKLMQRKKNRHLYMDITDVTISRRKPSPDLSPKKSTDINSYVNFRFGGESHTSSQPRPIRKSRSYENLLDGSPGQYSMKTKFERKAPQSYADLEFPTGPKTELGRCRSVGLVLSPVKDNARELYFGSVPSETKIKHHVSKSDRPRSLEYDQSSLTEQGSSPSRSQRITYTEVDFEKSRSVAVAVKELRSDSNLSNSSADQEASSI